MPSIFGSQYRAIGLQNKKKVNHAIKVYADTNTAVGLKKVGEIGRGIFWSRTDETPQDGVVPRQSIAFELCKLKSDGDFEEGDTAYQRDDRLDEAELVEDDKIGIRDGILMVAKSIWYLHKYGHGASKKSAQLKDRQLAKETAMVDFLHVGKVT